MLKTTLPLKAGAKWRTYANKNLREFEGGVESRDERPGWESSKRR